MIGRPPVPETCWGWCSWSQPSSRAWPWLPRLGVSRPHHAAQKAQGPSSELVVFTPMSTGTWRIEEQISVPLTPSLVSRGRSQRLFHGANRLPGQICLGKRLNKGGQIPPPQDFFRPQRLRMGTLKGYRCRAHTGCRVPRAHLMTHGVIFADYQLRKLLSNLSQRMTARPAEVTISSSGTPRGCWCGQRAVRGRAVAPARHREPGSERPHGAQAGPGLCHARPPPCSLGRESLP